MTVFLAGLETSPERPSGVRGFGVCTVRTALYLSVPHPLLRCCVPRSTLAFAVDSEGNLWVADARRPNTPTPSWNVFDREGVWLGHVEGPTGLRVTDIGGDYLLGLWRDEVEVEHVMLNALEKG